MKLLVLRTDRLGDVLLSLPSLVLLRESLPEGEIYFECSPHLKELLTPFFQVHRIHFFDGSHLQHSKFDGVLSLYCDSRTALRLFLARIPIRVGNFSKPVSCFLYNEGIKQQRSQARIHEAQYNLELTELLINKLGRKVAIAPAPICLPENAAAREAAETILRPFELENPFIVIHPGMGGSALNATAGNYEEIVARLQSELTTPVLISVGPSGLDGSMENFLRRKFRRLGFLSGLSLPVLAEVFRKASLVIAPSTGPLHLAHLVGTRVIGIYSPELSHHPQRWSPWGGTGVVSILFPESKSKYTMESFPWAEEVLKLAR